MQNRGTPIFDVDVAVVDQHRQVELDWTEIANLLHTTTRTLWNWRMANNYEVRSFLIYVNIFCETYVYI